MVILKANTVEEWLADCDAFCLAFMQYTYEWHQPLGADLQLLRDKLEEAHVNWVETVREWETKKFRHETESLSYTKIFAILLCMLSSTPYVGDMNEYEPFRKSAPAFPGSDEQRQEMLADLLGAPEVVSAFQFCVSILNFYESKRTDRKSPFAFRMTEASRHDLIVMLRTDEVSPLAVYTTLDAFYARD